MFPWTWTLSDPWLDSHGDGWPSRRRTIRLIIAKGGSSSIYYRERQKSAPLSGIVCLCFIIISVVVLITPFSFRQFRLGQCGLALLHPCIIEIYGIV